MAYILLVSYLIILAAQITSLVFAAKKKATKIWVGTFISEIIPLILSIITMMYFNGLPGYGFMPGLSYLGEILFSFGAAALYAIMILTNYVNQVPSIAIVFISGIKINELLKNSNV